MVSSRAGVSAAAPIRFKDFQESDLILYVAYFLKGPLTRPTELLPVAGSQPRCVRDIFRCGGGKARVSRSVHNRGRPAEAKKHAGNPRDPADPRPNQKQSRHGSPHGARPKARDARDLQAGNGLDS